MYVDPLGLAYYDKTWGWDDYLFGPTFWVRQKLGLDPSISQWVVDYSAGFIKLRGGVRNAKMAALLLIFSLVSTLAFVSLIVMPYSDVVSRS
jgi:hypothetical protein